jgi:sensor c-di-GMP phosphodiesterase-like protein
VTVISQRSAAQVAGYSFALGPDRRKHRAVPNRSLILYSSRPYGRCIRYKAALIPEEESTMSKSIWTDVFVYLAAGAMLGIVLLALVIWSIRRHHDPKLRIESDSPIDQLIHSLAGLSLSSVVPGNSGGRARERSVL